MAILKRVSDGKGDMGALTQAIQWNENGTYKEVIGNRPIIGCSLLVGSVTARSYSEQDYWTTTVITEILIEEEDYVKFKTSNSIYEWWK